MRRRVRRARRDLRQLRHRRRPPKTLRWTCSRRSGARPFSGSGATASNESYRCWFAFGEGDIAETEDRALAADACVALGGDDDARAADAHRAAHVLLDSDLRLEQRCAAGIRSRCALGLIAKASERGEHRPRAARARLIGPLQKWPD